MDNKTIKVLNNINKEFYLKTQVYFNRTRQFYWDGWKKLLPYLQDPSLKVLDVGCGNGRFGKFLQEKIEEVNYVGLDSNQYLLNKAKKTVKQGKLINQDILGKWPIKGKFDLIVFFGVLHHIPSKDRRLKLLRKTKNYLKPGGLLVFSNWHFKKFKRFNSYVISWKKAGLSKSQVERNDYILDWKKGVTAYRYVHLVDDQEIKWLVSKLEMKLVKTFTADGKQGQGNKYIILKKF